MLDYEQDLQFGIFVSPDADRAPAIVEQSLLAERLGLDLVSFQDHPYQPRFLDTWTLLAVIAAKTSRIQVAPNVANLPLRPPPMLARSVATLDILSGGRVSLGLGAGAFWDGIVALGGPRLTPGESVDAVEEAVDVLRAMWDTSVRSVHLDGKHYPVHGARPGPAPAHPVELWLGAYKPRMLRLTGSKADGWIPSMSYLELDQLTAMNKAIDAAAVDAGRDPRRVRRLLNINGAFAGRPGMLQGTPSEWVEQLTDLTLRTGMSAYVLSVSSSDEIRQFAEEVAPAVREQVAAARTAQPVDDDAPEAERDRPVEVVTGPRAVTATPAPSERLSQEQAWDESTRPTISRPPPRRRFGSGDPTAGQHLIGIHDLLRAELTQLRELVLAVVENSASPAKSRAFITRMAIRQNNWTLGTFCETYCRTVTQHHTLEDRAMFPHLKRADPDLEPVMDRLDQEHHTISELLERVDSALVGLVSDSETGMPAVRNAIDLLTDALLSHFSYEERELIGPLASFGLGFR